ncbi:MAG: SH3 domain-containing protein [Bacillota bacterium]
MRELAKEIKAKEEPILTDYEGLTTAAVKPTEKKLAVLVLGYQKFQLKTLDLFQTEVPDKFTAFGSISSHDVNVRRGPTSKEVSLFRAEKGTPVIVKEVKGLWVEVRFADGREGYVFKDYVHLESADE